MKKDILASLIIGEISAWLMLLIAKNLISGLPGWWLLPLVFPLLCAAGMVIALFFEKRLAILYQFAKFFLVGGMNVLVDLGVLNLLILVSTVSTGLGYSAFKGISFLVATTNSYFWNKSWTFSERTDSWNKSNRGRFGQFLVVSAIGFFINVFIASLFVNIIGPYFRFACLADSNIFCQISKAPVFSEILYNRNLWANASALVGSVVGLVWNFVGYKFIVFNK